MERNVPGSGEGRVQITMCAKTRGCRVGLAQCMQDLSTVPKNSNFIFCSEGLIRWSAKCSDSI